MNPRALLVLVLAGSLVAGASGPAPHAEGTPAPALLSEAFPLEVSISFPVALLHWLDSLVHLEGPGLTAGKTRDAHRYAYAKLHGQPTGQEAKMLELYHRARSSYPRTSHPDERERLTEAFCDAADLEGALQRAQKLLGPELGQEFVRAVRHFEPRYREIWRDGQVPEGFLADVKRSALRDDLARFLARVAGFFDVPVEHDPPPRVFLMPVPRGWGTHAQAIGRNLLIEVRRGEGLHDQVGPIVHETAHFLYQRIEPERLAALERAAVEAKPEGATAWRLLHEALPTAIGQGVAGRMFRGRHWSMTEPWYHRGPVNAYAKEIFLAVQQALDDQTAVFDEAFVRKLVGIFGS